METRLLSNLADQALRCFSPAVYLSPAQRTFRLWAPWARRGCLLRSCTHQLWALLTQKDSESPNSAQLQAERRLKIPHFSVDKNFISNDNLLQKCPEDLDLCSDFDSEITQTQYKVSLKELFQSEKSNHYIKKKKRKLDWVLSQFPK